MSRLPEILAPAGDMASLRAALSAGADAVYFGLDEGLNARARAANFPVATLGETCDRVHRAGAKAYVTLNTLVFEAELPFLETLLRACAEAGVDALIVQDPAVALLARQVAPTMEVHASTQMTVSSPEAAAFAGRLGVTRIVVPRELSVDEIRTFRAGTPIELEVFVHGALCMSWSGQCLTSEAWGGRSANRGQCAQSCRLPYDLVVDGAVRDTKDVRYLLSPLDLAGVRAIPGLVDVGVASFKIEGRLKGPGYVASAVEGYRRWRDAVVEGRAEQGLAALRDDLARMGLAYSRGFSDGFLGGSDHQDLVEGRFPKHRGVLVGIVAEVAGNAVRVVRAERRPSGGIATAHGYAPQGSTSSPLPGAADSRVPVTPMDPVPGTGIGFDTGHPEAVEPGGPVFAVEATTDGWWLRFGRPGPDLSRVAPGHRVWASGDPRVERAGREAAEAEPEGRVPVRMVVSGRAGEPLSVRLVTSRAEVAGATASALSPATGRGLDEDTLRAKLGAFGGTSFRLDALDLDLADGTFVPVSELKALRRDLAAELEARWLAAHRHVTDPAPAAQAVVAGARSLAARRAWSPPPSPTVVPLCRTAEQLAAAIDLGFPEVELDWMERVGLAKAVATARSAGLRVTVATVRVQKPGEASYDEHTERMKPDAVLVRHWGGLVHFAGLPDGERPIVHGDFSLNVTNSVTAHHLLAFGADTLTASHDLDEAQLHAMLEHVPAERITVVAHHHIATFHTEHCVYAHTLSHGRDFRTCGRPCEKHRVALRDPIGHEHPVVVDVGCRNTVFNAAAQSAASAVPGLVARGVRRFRVEFVWEDEATARNVLLAYRDLVAGRAAPSDVVRRVAVHEQFGVTRGTMRSLSPAT